MIVFFGSPDDAPLADAIDEAASRNLEHVILDQARLDCDQLRLDVGPARISGSLWTCGMEVRLDQITSVYARPLALPAFDDERARMRAEWFNTAFLDWLDTAECLVVNRPGAMLSNGSKPFQLQLIAEAGFLVPDTLVTNHPEDVREFQRRHGRVIYKSISGIRSIVSELDGPGLDRLDRIRALPTQFQAYVDGVDVRVHVVGQRCFATEVRSGSTDYRYAHRDGEPATLAGFELPAAIERLCVDLAAGFDLPFCGIDLRRRPDGEHVCFEVNPMPAFSYFATGAQQPIAAALVDLLASATVGAWLPFART